MHDNSILLVPRLARSFGARHYDDASFVLLRVPPPLGAPSASVATAAASSAAVAAASADADADEPYTPAAFPIRRAQTIQEASAEELGLNK